MRTWCCAARRGRGRSSPTRASATRARGGGGGGEPGGSRDRRGELQRGGSGRGDGREGGGAGRRPGAAARPGRPGRRGAPASAFDGPVREQRRGRDLPLPPHRAARGALRGVVRDAAWARSRGRGATLRGGVLEGGGCAVAAGRPRPRAGAAADRGAHGAGGELEAAPGAAGRRGGGAGGPAVTQLVPHRCTGIARPVVRFFAAPVEAPDLPGHGSSSDATSWDDALDRLEPVIKARPVVLFGYSIGARLTLDLPLRHPDPITRPILEGCTPALEDPPEP